MHGNTDIFTKEKTISLNTVEDMVKFALGGFEKKSSKPNDIQPYIDFDKGWKFTEDDKDFLISYYENWIQACIEDFCGDFIEEPTKILNCLKDNGVQASKELIQTDARCMADAVCDDIYNYYDGDANILKLIENSILDAQW